MTWINDVFFIEFIIISYEYNIRKIIIQVRIQYKEEKLMILNHQITLSQSELCQIIIDIENLRQKNCIKIINNQWNELSQNISENKEE